MENGNYPGDPDLSAITDADRAYARAVEIVRTNERRAFAEFIARTDPTVVRFVPPFARRTVRAAFADRAR